MGATGRTGRHVVEQALAAGHEVRALVRSRAKLNLQHPKLEVLEGDATDAAAVQRLVAGCDATLSTLGPTAQAKDVCSRATENVIRAGTPRYVFISGAGTDLPGDRKDAIGKLVSFLVRTLSPEVFHDKVRELELVQKSGLRWTAVRPPRLVERPAKGVARVSVERSPGSAIPYPELAAFALRCLTDDSLVGKAPFVAGAR